MNSYIKLKERQQEEINALPMGFAFSQSQFDAMMKGWGLDPKKDLDKIYKMGFAGGFFQKKDSDLIHGTFDRHEKESADAIAADKDGEGYIYEMFLYELDNHEFSYTGDCTDALMALGYTVDDVFESPALKRGLEKAVTEIRRRQAE